MSTGLDPTYVSLVGLSQSFLSLRPPDVKSALRCLQAVFSLRLRDPAIECRTNLQIAQILRKETKNVDMARQHLEQAVTSYWHYSGFWLFGRLSSIWTWGKIIIYFRLPLVASFGGFFLLATQLRLQRTLPCSSSTKYLPCHLR